MAAIRRPLQLSPQVRYEALPPIDVPLHNSIEIFLPCAYGRDPYAGTEDSVKAEIPIASLRLRPRPLFRRMFGQDGPEGGVERAARCGSSPMSHSS
jgi:hypothetical protein